MLKRNKRFISSFVLSALLIGGLSLAQAPKALADEHEDLKAKTMQDTHAMESQLSKADDVVSVTSGYATSGFKLKEGHADVDVYIESLPNLSIKLDKNSIQFDNIDLIKENLHENCIDMTVESNMPYDLFVKGLDDFKPVSDKFNQTKIPVSTLSTQVGKSGYKDVKLNEDVYLLTENSIGDKHFDVSFKMKRYMKALAGRYKTTLRYTAKQK